MRIVTLRSVLSLAVVGLSFAVATTPSHATFLQISVVNNQPAGGFAITPLWFGIHNGTFSSFSNGSAATGNPIQTLAELGSVSALTAAFTGQGVQGTLSSNGPVPPFQPGNANSSLVNVLSPSSLRFFSYAAMVVPTNDFFLANDNPTAIPLFDGSGNFTGTKTIQIFGRDIWDAGTEVNNIGFGAAFIAGDNATDHVAENGIVHHIDYAGADSAYLSSISGRMTATGYSISHLISPDDLIATITITQAVPEPSTIVLMGIGAITLCFTARAQKLLNSRRTGE